MSTSKLQREIGNYLDKRLPECRIRENYKPDWLISSDGARLELDFYIEEIKVAFEVQGDQHFSFVEFFHKTQENYELCKLRDADKKDLCAGAGVALFEITALYEVEQIVDKYFPKKEYSQFQEKILSEIRAMDWVRNNSKRQQINKDIALFLSAKMEDDISQELINYYSQNRADIDRRVK
jgi:hypothetical protein